MKKIATVTGILILAAVLAVPVFAGGGYGRGMMGGPGMMGGRGPGMMGGPGSANCPMWSQYSGANNPNLTDEQVTKLNELDKTFFPETGKLREDMWAKRRELDTLLSAAKPDLEKAKAVQKEISDLRNQLDQKRLEYNVKVREIAPEALAGNSGYGRRGFAGRGPGYGPGPGYGSRWN